jgi:hypothetical protein
MAIESHKIILLPIEIELFTDASLSAEQIKEKAKAFFAALLRDTDRDREIELVVDGKGYEFWKKERGK